MSEQAKPETIVNQILDDAALAVHPPLLPKPMTNDLEAKMREKASTINLHYDLECGCEYAKVGKLCMVHEAITQALLDVARETAAQAAYGHTKPGTLLHLIPCPVCELAQARQSFSHVAQCLRAAMCLDHRAARDRQGGTVPWPEQGECLACQLAQARADLERAQKQMRTAEEALQESKFFSSVQLISGRIDAALEALTKKE